MHKYFFDVVARLDHCLEQSRCPFTRKGRSSAKNKTNGSRSVREHLLLEARDAETGGFPRARDIGVARTVAICQDLASRSLRTATFGNEACGDARPTEPPEASEVFAPEIFFAMRGA